MANNNETSQKGALKKSMSDRHSYVASFHRHAPAGARLNLEYASATLRNDRDVVLTAVQQNGRSLQYASETLRNDRDVVLAAVEQNGYSLEYASSDLKADRAVVLAAMRKTPKVFLLAITTRGDYDEQSLLFRDRSLWLEWCRSEPSECTERTPPMDPRLWSEILVVAKSRLATRDSERQLVCDITDLAFEPLLPALVAGGESPTVTVHTVYCFNGQQEVWLGLSPETNVTQFADLVLRRKFPTTPSSQQLGLLLSSPPAPLIYLRLLFKNAPLSVWTGDELLTSLLNPIRVVQGTSSEQQREHAPAESLSASPPRCSASVPDQLCVCARVPRSPVRSTSPLPRSAPSPRLRQSLRGNEMRRERETSRREPVAQKRIEADLSARGEILFGARVYLLSCTCKRLARSHEQDVDDDDGNDAGRSIHCSFSRRTTTRKKRRDYNTRSRVSNM